MLKPPSWGFFVIKKSSMIRNMSKHKARAALLLITIMIVGGIGNGNLVPKTRAQTDDLSDLRAEESNAKEQREDLETRLAELEREIAEQEKQVQTYQKQGTSLKSEINTLNSNIKKLNLQIKAVEITISKVNLNIIETQKQINKTENKIDLHKEALGKALQAIDESDQEGFMELLLAHEKFSDFFNAINNIALVQENLRAQLKEIVVLRGDLLSQKEELALKKEDNENLKRGQEVQKQTVSLTQKEKEKLLTTTKGKESEYQKLLQKSKETAAQIRSRIFQLLGGGELTFEKAYEYARLAEKATNVRAAFILAILNQESNFGKNVGQCKYNDIHPKTGVTVMRPSDISIFENILERLGIDKNSRSAYVSCPIVRDGSYGGAMGPAQFIPSTWKLYEKEVSRVTGSNPANPWSNADAFAATALYLKESLNSTTCKNYSNEDPSNKQLLLERCAAAQYYSGKRWYTYRWVYGEPVAQKAKRFQNDINILNG
ncbi:hypothetical protein A3A21_03555 [Candidatus Jorgensenbacteria bacterium RIFCSPLOWO2_01_FULL_45_25b]|uniref:Transglycosylase SLT domain-containing protein n=1 Tax=Candidatus Jorgensenbacteria bacterium RIFCSPLOWO2_01_FULL_45_25b TaxID=1798471 RepID=A0A1F6BYN5_9BACT|nr:MAG: hypothetical protein A3A21_03555 [Candidatus Jorgensenbacteria bacterium RIFCSPLOWO2_01_FULL_45_25b]